jgi:hypothetical protein
MKVLIEMSVEVYDSLLDKCDQSCAEYYTLTKGSIRDRVGPHYVPAVFLCGTSSDQLHTLRDNL